MSKIDEVIKFIGLYVHKEFLPIISDLIGEVTSYRLPNNMSKLPITFYVTTPLGETEIEIKDQKFTSIIISHIINDNVFEYHQLFTVTKGLETIYIERRDRGFLYNCTRRDYEYNRENKKLMPTSISDDRNIYLYEEIRNKYPDFDIRGKNIVDFYDELYDKGFSFTSPCIVNNWFYIKLNGIPKNQFFHNEFTRYIRLTANGKVYEGFYDIVIENTIKELFYDFDIGLAEARKNNNPKLEYISNRYCKLPSFLLNIDKENEAIGEPTIQYKKTQYELMKEFINIYYENELHHTEDLDQIRKILK